ncbi:MAG: DUF6063 family protein [Tissierellia bacterium]|nr:DUF6063 family protein [Tissierellia bacterium]
MYTMDEIKDSSEIMYYLLENGQISEERERELFKKYSESENIMSIVKNQGSLYKCSVETYNRVIYLIPDVTNDFLGYSKGELKKLLCKSNSNDKDYYLSQFVILTLLVVFYSSQGRTSKNREFLKGWELQNIVSEKLKEGLEKSKDESFENESGIAYSNIVERWEALRSTDKITMQKTTKEGFIINILKFLETQGLINYLDEEDKIYTTKKLDNFMDWNLLNKNNYNRVLKALGEDTDE